MALIDLLNGSVCQKDYLIDNNVVINYEKFPKRVYGFIFSYRNINLIIINKNTSVYKQRHTILHELAHLELSHIYKKKKLLEFSIDGLEDEADEYIKCIIEKI